MLVPVHGWEGVRLIEQLGVDNPGATPLYAAACAGSVRCASLLCEAGANVDARGQRRVADARRVPAGASGDGDAPLVMQHSARRDLRGASSAPTAVARRGGRNLELLRWLRASSSYLSCTTSTCSTKARRGAAPAPRPSRAMAASAPPSSRACTRRRPRRGSSSVRRGRGRQRRTRCGALAHARAVELIALGYLVAKHPAVGCEHGSFVDAWREHVMHAISRDMSARVVCLDPSMDGAVRSCRPTAVWDPGELKYPGAWARR